MTTASNQKALAKAIHGHTKAMNRLLRQAMSAGIRIALRVDGTLDPKDGKLWDIGVYCWGTPYKKADYVIIEWASRVRAFNS